MSSRLKGQQVQRLYTWCGLRSSKVGRLRKSDRESSRKWAERGSIVEFVGQLLSTGDEEGIGRVRLPELDFK